MEIIEGAIHQVLDSLPSPKKHYAYGTAGFRDRYDETVHGVFFKVGIIAAMRSVVTKKAIGVMVTASHNALPDNGVKIVDPNGGMLSQSWEALAESLVNATGNDFYVKLHQAMEGNAILAASSSKPVVVIGRDCRYHSPILAEFITKGVRAMNGIALDIGEVITPLLHFVVADFNEHAPCTTESFDADMMKTRYFQTLWAGYNELLSSGDVDRSTLQPLILDTAFGVGSKTIEGFFAAAAQDAIHPWAIEVRNRDGEGEVNADCGAEHVQKGQVPPAGVSSVKDHGKLLCSFDGDGDRIVFHAYLDEAANSWLLLDGDRIAALIATFLYQELSAAGLSDQVHVGVVQTAYANGSSTQFLKSQGVPVLMAKTGVKFIHHKAEELDVGIYFEANGHGTVLFSENYVNKLKATTDGGDTRKALAIRRLHSCLKIVNQTVGDALSDMLFCLVILSLLGMDYQKWNALYTELPSKQVKLAVADKSKLKCSEDETYLVEPVSLQQKLNEAMQSVSNGRCFVRPSGTEDVVRIYAEASTKEEVEVVVAKSREAINEFFA